MIDVNELVFNNIINNDRDEAIYENEYMVVYEVLGEVSTDTINWVKRIQIVNWKSKKNERKELDIRRYNKKKNRYGKGISFTDYETEEFIKIMKMCIEHGIDLKNCKL